MGPLGGSGRDGGRDHIRGCTEPRRDGNPGIRDELVVLSCPGAKVSGSNGPAGDSAAGLEAGVGVRLSVGQGRDGGPEPLFWRGPGEGWSHRDGGETVHVELLARALDARSRRSGGPSSRSAPTPGLLSESGSPERKCPESSEDVQNTELQLSEARDRAEWKVLELVSDIFVSLGVRWARL